MKEARQAEDGGLSVFVGLAGFPLKVFWERSTGRRSGADPEPLEGLHKISYLGTPWDPRGDGELAWENDVWNSQLNLLQPNPG